MPHAFRLSFVAMILGASASGAQEQRPDSSDMLRPNRVPADVGATGATPGLPPRERGIAVGILDSTDEGLASAPTLAHALQARLPGISVSQGQGLVGSSARVWLRGPSSLMVNEPLLIIDGARTHAANPIFVPFLLDREVPSRLDDIDMEMVERVEVLRGPAAAAIYGPGASKGVILITTKRGHPGSARWTAFAESGPSIETTEFPANFGTIGVATANPNPVVNCPLAQQAAGSCTPVSRRSWNPLESASPFRTGWANGAGLTVSGGTGGISYFIGGTHDRANGVYDNDHSRATSARFSLTASPIPTVDLQVTGGHRLDDRRHPAESWIEAGLLGEFVDDPQRRGYRGGYSRLARIARDEDVRRTTASLNATWRPLPWLRASAIVGYDRLGVRTDLTIRDPVFSFPVPSADSATFIERSLDRPESRTAAVAATASYVVRGLAARSSIGFEYLRDDDRGRFRNAVIPDQPCCGSESGTSFDLRRPSKGMYVQQHVGWNDRLFLTGSLRADRASSFDVDLDQMISRSVDVVWVGIDSASSASPRWLDELRLRAAYGRGGDHAVLTVRPASPGDPNPVGTTAPAEQGTEIEAGVDASMLAHRVRAEVTYHRATTRRGLEIISAFGGPSLANTARIRTAGIESSIDARIVATDRVAWDLGGIVSAQRNTIEHLGGPPFVLSNQYFAPGESIGEYFAAPYTYVDTNGDGLIAPSEVVVQSDGFGSVGSPFPKYEAALRTGITFGGRLHIGAVLDHRSGAKVYDKTAQFRCRLLCEAQHDPATSLEAQSRSVAATNGTPIAYIRDADYTKLREVRLGLTLPSRVARLAGASSARITLTGRNLFTWTPYDGLDPEVISATYSSVEVADNYYQPTLRSFTARLDVSW
jgi:TonB-dependent SusC/RagA subfamily outer membrane receptor